MRLALFTLESLANAEAVHDFVAANPGRIALLGVSDPHRPAMGGMVGQMLRHVRRSGLGFLPYLAVNFALPGLLRRRNRLSDLCRRHGIPVHRVRDVNGAETAAAIRASGAELILCFHFDQILTAETLALPPLGGVNVHPSLLPRHRGPIPTFHALLEGATGVSVHVMAPRIDAGAVLAQRAVPLPPGTSASGAARALHLAALPLLEDALARLPAPPGPAPGLLPYCPFPDRAALRQARAAGVRLVRTRDAWQALRAPAGGW
ncbi:formyltransferase family protein [Rhodovarius lipocyclicus]|uniref:formyltransferase family protein n=1 Tax=Rhodovarius lipocyclicus TaxID=268410 RepID=UPI001358325F|nr:formyltransferase family protein [Rhodovarius lipocyclicus]